MGISSMPFLIGNIFLIAGFIYTFIVYFNRFSKIDRWVIVFSSVFLFLFIGQIITFSSIDVPVFIAFFIRIFYAYFTVKIIGKDIDRYYINSMYFFAIVSLIFWSIISIIPSFKYFLLDNITPLFYPITYFPGYDHLIVFTMNFGNGEFLRNSGAFWEPGGFGIFLNIALIFNLIRTKKIIEKKNIVFILAVITTFSTGSYITLFILLFAFLIYSKRFSYIIFGIPLIFILATTYFEELPFMYPKILKNIEYAQGNYTNLQRTRFVSALADIDDLRENPIIGKGRFNIPRYDDVEKFHQSADYRNNGTTKFLAQFGLLGFIFYFFTMYKSFRNYCLLHDFPLKFAYFIIIIIMVAGFSQTIFTKPFFFALAFMFISISNQNEFHTRKS